MPYGNVPASACCPACGFGVGQPSGFAGQTMPGTFAPGPGFGMGMGAPATGMGMGAPGVGMGMAAPGMGLGGMPPWLYTPWVPPWLSPVGLGWGLGGARRWGGTYSPQFLLTGLPTDEEIVEMVYDAIDADPVIPFDADITVESDAGTVTLTGTVDSKEIKHAAGDDAWWIPGVDDVHNDLEVRRRRPARAADAEAEHPSRGAPAAASSRAHR